MRKKAKEIKKGRNGFFDMKEKTSAARSSSLTGPDFTELELARRELEQEEIERFLQPLPESVRLLLRFARERGLIKKNAPTGC
jgi:hypothetical protein